MAVNGTTTAVASKGTKRKTVSHDIDSAVLPTKIKRTAKTDDPVSQAESAPAPAATKQKKKSKTVAEDADDTADGSESELLNVALIKRYEREAIESRQHINHITALLEHIEQQQQQQQQDASAASLHTATAAYQSLYRILEHYVEAGELSVSAAGGASPASLSGQFRQWLHKLYMRYVACSLSFLGHSHSLLQLSALHATMSLVKLSAASLSPDAAASSLSSGLFGNVVTALLASSHYTAAHETFMSSYLLPHLDLRVAALRAIKANIKRAATTLTETTTDNTLTLLIALSTLDTPPPDTSPYTTATLSPTALTTTLSATYLTFLSHRHTPAAYKRILEHLDSHIVPSVSNPLLLADFLTDSYTIGGIVSLLSLSSLFHLISRYNLDYPHFYHKLYTLCTPQLTLSKHRTHLFVLLSKFLSSAYLPSSLVAAYCKRLARLAIVGGGGVDGSVELLRLVWGLVRRNRSVSGMVWGQAEVEREKEGKMESLTEFLLKRQVELAEDGDKRAEKKAAEATTVDGQKVADVDDIFDDNLSDSDDDEQQEASTTVNGAASKQAAHCIDPLTVIQSSTLASSSVAAVNGELSSFTTDQFLPLEDDPAASNATASTLWEVRTLTQHYAPAVRSVAQLFYAVNAPKGEVDQVGVGKVGDSEGYDAMMKKEMERRKNQKVAVNYGRRSNLFEAGDIICSNFTWS